MLSQQLSPEISASVPINETKIQSEQFIDAIERTQQTKTELKESKFPSEMKLYEENLHKSIINKSSQNLDTLKQEQVFQTRAKEGNELVSNDDFKVSLPQNQLELKGKLVEIEEDIASMEINNNEYKRKLVEQRLKQQMNEYNIMVGSKLNVSIIECRDLILTNKDGTCDPYVVGKCEGQIIETSVQYQTQNPH